MESQAQRRWMWATRPEMARRWEDHTPEGVRLPERVGPRKRKRRRRPAAKSAAAPASVPGWLVDLVRRA